MGNNKIVIAAFVVTSVGVWNAFTQQKPLTPVFIGGYIFILVLSIADSFGGPLSEIAGGLSLVAMTYVLLALFPWQTVIQLAQGKSITTK